MTTLDLVSIRSQFPAFERQFNGLPVAYFDGPAGSQVPQRVADAVADYLLNTNANQGAVFATSQETDVLLNEAHRTLADFLGADDPDCVFFGPNMTTMTLGLSRAISKSWQSGDEIIVSDLDHDANVTPWTLAAEDAGATVHRIRINAQDCTLDMDDFRSKLSERTKLVAIGYASNATGTINPIREIADVAHNVGALVFVDAVHYAPHGLIDVQQLGCDFIACSAYKFFGPHVGVMWGRCELLEGIQPYKLRPSTNTLPGRWMTGTQCHEGIAGAAEAVKYIADLGRTNLPPTATLRQRLTAAFEAIEQHEHQLMRELLPAIADMPGVKIWGITEPERFHQRVPTISITHSKLEPRAMARELRDDALFAWDGNHYAFPFTTAMGLEPDGTLRIGLLHYNTHEDIERLVRSLNAIVQP